MPLFQLALFVLGIMGSLWTTVYALFEYRAERLIEIDALVQRVLFEEVFPQYCTPILLARLAQWQGNGVGGGGTGAQQAFTGLHSLCILSGTEFETYVALSVESLCRRRLWLSRRFITRRVRDIAPQYPWRMHLLADLRGFLIDA